MMTLSELSIRRHVLAVMISAVIVLFGLISLQDVGTDRIPNIDFPVISVTVTQTGADPEIIDSAITSEVERAVNTVPGIDNITSQSVPGASIVNIIFDLEKDVDVAFNEVQAQVSQVVAELPSDADQPVVDKVEFDAQPIMWLALQGDRTRQQLDTYARNEIRQQIENINGVGEVRIGGGLERNIRVEIDPDRLNAFGVTIPDLMAAFEEEHVQMPGGFLVGGDREDQLKLDLEYHSPEELEEMVIGAHGGSLVYLRDVADVIDGLADRRGLARFNGEPTVGLGIVKVSGANTVAIIEEVKEILDDQIRPQLPPGMQITISSDESVFILEQIDSLYLTIALGIIFSALVMWLFLKNLRSTLIIALSIPVSLMAAVAVVYFFGYTLNSITMLAMLLLIGIVVDDAIVVLENIYRHREQYKEGPVKGAISGSKEVFFAVIASTLALVSIFASVIFLEATVGRFFESFAVVVTFGVLASSLVALTLIPMLCSRFLTVRTEHGPVYNALEKGFRGLESVYRRSLAAGLNWRWSVLAASLVGLVVVGSLIFPRVGGEFAPSEDTGQFVVIFQTPQGSSIDYTDRRMAEIEQIVLDQPEVDRMFAAIGLGDAGQVYEGISFIRMVPRNERSASQQEVIDRISPKLGQLAGVRAFATEVPFVPGQRGDPLQFAVTGPDLTEVASLAREMRSRLEEVDGMGRLDMQLDLERPELALNVDRERARDLGMTARQVAQAVEVMVGGIDVARFNDPDDGGQRYDIRLKGREDAFTRPDDLQKLYLRSGNGELVRLDTVARMEAGIGPAVINRYNLNYSAEFYGSPTMPLGEAVEKLQAIGDDVLPLGYNVELMGQAEEMQRAIGAMLFVLFLAVSLVYIVLASQFNSFTQPLIIMAAQPIALVGGIVGLWVGGFTLNIFSMIGMVLLMGLVTKNGILLVDLTNQYRRNRGLSVDEALQEACPIRLRPVLMTSLTLILALLPAALGFGAGAETNAPMAAAIIAGMIAALVLTLLLIPIAYSLVENFLERRGFGRRTREIEEEPV
ncbi:efflux RND transporter permease subunit [Ectothiorhodospira sp. BSL-9]|uniref:efflux RND transporter permease subunit n=1 Tax=Ectothiorhodospira sp. BSL-9 TaxID=1442136 RepID=UPI000A6F5CE9|nr:efflux RND transporter permease subunit [Ectothiorhodospira sp. BSL-9]